MPLHPDELSTVAAVVAIAWPFVVFILFFLMKPREAIINSIVYGFLFLPNINFHVTGVPHINKFNLTVLPVYVLSWLFAFRHHLNFRFRPVDFIIVLWGISPLFSSLSNELGFYDGLSISYNRLVSYGSAYFLGRVFFGKLEDKLVILKTIFYGAIVLLPFIFYESRFSPMLHHDVYGYHPHEFQQTIRFEGWRPVIFFRHGLQMGLWIAVAAVSGVWLFRKGLITNLADHPTERMVKFTLLVTLFIANAVSKSAGSLLILIAGLAILFLTDFFVASTFLRLGALISPIFLGLRISGIVTGKWFTETFSYLNTLRAQSLQFRFDNENLAIQHALNQPFFGWGSWGREKFNFISRVTSLSIYDSLWIISFSMNGFFGLILLVGLYITPTFVFMSNFRNPKHWRQPHLSAALLGCVAVLMVLFDNLLNDHPVPVYYMLIGSLMEYRRR